jgi:uncharacterized protein YdeI (YjbR/CyaY-like superfamily)
MNTQKIIEMLTRIPVPPGQLALYKALYFADQPLTVNSLSYMMRRGDAESAQNVMNALANRISGTEGVDLTPDTPHFLEAFERHEVAGKWRYTMRSELRDAIDSLPKLRDVLETMTFEEIYQTYSYEDGGLDLS